jgi:uncharacterized protein (TIGR02246 family)
MRPDDPIRRVIDELVSAWNRADAGAFGGLFTQDADYIGADGVAHHGRNAIEQLLRQPPEHVRVCIDAIVSIQFSADRAEARFGWLSESGQLARRGTIQLLMAHEQQGWRITILKNTPS